MHQPIHERYNARIENINHVYDGDTLEHVMFRLPGLQPIPNAELGEIYPDIFVQEDGPYVHINVRLAGIDCPERHPRHAYPDGNLRPTFEIEREQELGLRARDALRTLILQNGLQFEIRNPQIGKYAGRIVAEVWLHEEMTGDYLNASEYLIDQGLAYPYQGGKKRIWGSF